MISEKTETAITALNGTRSRLTRRNSAQPGHPPVARERVPGARGAGQAGRAAEELADGRDQDHQLRRPGVEGAGEDRADEAAAAVVDRAHVVGREQEREQHEPADQRRAEHRPPDALRRGDRGAAGLLGGVRRGVVAGLRVHRQQEADRQHQEPEARGCWSTPPPKPVLLIRSPKTKLGALVVVGHEDRAAPMIDRDAEQVPADRDVVEQRQEPVGEDVDQRVERPG